MLGSITIIPKTVFTLLGNNPSTQSIPLVTEIGSPDWVSGVLVARFHSGAIQANTAVNIRVQNASYPDDDPSVVFLGGSDVASISMPTGTVAGALFTANFATPITSNLRVVLECVVSGATTQSTVGVSVELVGRPA